MKTRKLSKCLLTFKTSSAGTGTKKKDVTRAWLLIALLTNIESLKICPAQLNLKIGRGRMKMRMKSLQLMRRATTGTGRRGRA